MKHLLFTLFWGMIIYFPHIAPAQNKPELRKELKTVKALLENILSTVGDQRDSLIVSLNDSRYREHSLRMEAIRLSQLLEHSKYRLDSLQNAIATKLDIFILREYRRQMEQVTTERNNLANQNQQLMARLAQSAKGDQSLFAFKMSVVPGQIHNNRFSPSIKARNTDRLQISFLLTRALSAEENIVIKLFDATNNEIPLIADYRSQLGKPTPTNQQIIIKPATNNLRKFIRGNYSVRLYLTILDEDINNQSIGIAEFSLR
ncbi:MAG TPA: hypothetical protein DCS93_10945 [Microscillaceae bacterium]|nr:hypothetical protein [Microscillaceae bacterium]